MRILLWEIHYAGFGKGLKERIIAYKRGNRLMEAIKAYRDYFGRDKNGTWKKGLLESKQAVEKIWANGR